MAIVLKRFSQDVDLENPEVSQSFLVFVREDDSEFRIPVPNDTIRELTKVIYGYEAKKSVTKEAFSEAAEETERQFEEEVDRVSEEIAEEIDGAEVFKDFSGDDDVPSESREDLEDLEPERGILSVSPAVIRKTAQTRMQQIPQTEDEVPSL